MMIRIGAIGASREGLVQMQLIAELQNQFLLTGFYEPNLQLAKVAAEQLHIMPCFSLDHLLEQVDAVVICSSFKEQFNTAIKAIRNFKHVLVENPSSFSIDEVRKLSKVVREADVVFQLGFADRYNPAFLAVKTYINQPFLIEIQRKISTTLESKNQSSIMNELLHDIDMILCLTGANVRKLNSNGFHCLANEIDVASVRIELDNGCILQIHVSRLFQQAERVIQIYQRESKIQVDLLKQQVEVYQPLQKKTHQQRMLSITPGNPVKRQLESFYTMIENRDLMSSVLDGEARVLEVLKTIDEQSKISSIIGKEEYFFSGL
jgi:predicted dehydrogenase